jgi:hypothetical protein
LTGFLKRVLAFFKLIILELKLPSVLLKRVLRSEYFLYFSLHRKRFFAASNFRSLFGAKFSPVLELVVDHPVGEALPANPYSLEDAVAGQLMHHEAGVEDTRLLVRVGHDAAAGPML